MLDQPGLVGIDTLLESHQIGDMRFPEEIEDSIARGAKAVCVAHKSQLFEIPKSSGPFKILRDNGNCNGHFPPFSYFPRKQDSEEEQ